MDCCMADFDLLDVRLGSTGRKRGDIVDFLVTQHKQPNYLNHCLKGWSEFDIVETFQKYTQHETGLCTKVNLALACDSPDLNRHGTYIYQLNQAIRLTPNLAKEHRVFRGVELSAEEVAEMEKLKDFFIPSFTSTSVDFEKSYSNKKNGLLCIEGINCNTRIVASMTNQFSKYADQEEEVLFGCYSAFWLKRVERTNPNKYVCTLLLDDFATLTCDHLALEWPDTTSPSYNNTNPAMPSFVDQQATPEADLNHCGHLYI